MLGLANTRAKLLHFEPARLGHNKSAIQYSMAIS